MDELNGDEEAGYKIPAALKALEPAIDKAIAEERELLLAAAAEAEQLTPRDWHFIRKALNFAIEAATSSQGDPIRGQIWAGRYREILGKISHK